MWSARRDDDHVARLDPAGHTALNPAAALARTIFLRHGDTGRGPHLWIEHGASGDERRGAINHVVDLGHLVVLGSDAGLVLLTPDRADADVVAARVHHAKVRQADAWQGSALAELGLNVGGGNISGRGRFGGPL